MFRYLGCDLLIFLLILLCLKINEAVILQDALCFQVVHLSVQILLKGYFRMHEEIFFKLCGSIIDDMTMN